LRNIFFKGKEKNIDIKLHQNICNER